MTCSQNNNKHITTCPHYRGVLTTGVLTTGVSSLQGCPHYRGDLTTGVSSLQGCPHYRCPHYRGVLTTGVPTTGVSSLQGCPHYRNTLTTVSHEKYVVLPQTLLLAEGSGVAVGSELSDSVHDPSHPCHWVAVPNVDAPVGV